MQVENVFHPWRRRRKKVRRWRKHKPGKLERLQHRFRRWWRRWQRLWRRWQTRIGDTGLAKAALVIPSSSCVEQAQPILVPEEAGERTCGTEAQAIEAVGEVNAPLKRGPGCPCTIPTKHICCPNEQCPAYGRLGDDPLHDIVGCGTYSTRHGERRQMYKCNVCGRLFSETARTPLFGLKTPMRTVCIALQELVEGIGIRSVARIHGVKPDTVLEWLKRAGEHAERLSEYMLRELNVSQVQLDELWTFVRKKERTLKGWENLQREWGDTWIWVAFDPMHKLVLAIVVGERNEEEAVGLLARLRKRLAKACRLLLTSDSLPHYAAAMLQVFGVLVQPRRKGKRGRYPQPRRVPPEDLQYATIHKERKHGRVVSVTTQIIYGSREQVQALLESVGQKINTAFAERVNLTLRHLVSRLHRKSLCFSKEREYLVYHLHLAVATYHLSRYHRSLRVWLPEPVPTRGSGTPKKWQERTPAMAAGLTDHRWSMRELLMCQVPAVP